MKVEGAAVSRTERTEEVGRTSAREDARGPRERSTAGSVGRAVMPAREALGSVRLVGEGLWETYRPSSWLMSCRFSIAARFSTGSGAAIEEATRAKSAIAEAYMAGCGLEV